MSKIKLNDVVDPNEITEIYKLGKKVKKIVDSYYSHPDKYENFGLVREDTTKLASLLIYTDPRVGLFEALLDNIIDIRKRTKSGYYMNLYGTHDENGRRYTDKLADCQARILVEEYDNIIAELRKITKFGRSIIFSTRKFLDQITMNSKSIYYEMKHTNEI